jgi:hypothetical protein
MSYVENLSVAFPPATQTAIITALNQALTDLNNVVVVTLTTDERQNIPNVEAARIFYVDKAVNNFSNDFPNLVSRAITTASAQNAFDTYQFLGNVMNLLKELQDRATDAQHNMGNTTYNYTLDMYHAAKRYVGELPGADVVVQELQPLFENQGPQNNPAPETPTT